MVFKFADAVGHQSEGAAIIRNEFCEAECVIIEDGDITGGLIGDMDVVALVGEANECAAHGDNVVVGVWREAEDAFGEDVIEGLWSVTGTFAGIGFSAGPADDGALEVSEDGEVNFVGGAVVGKEVLESAFVVI